MIPLVARPAVECSGDSAPCASPPRNRSAGATRSRFPATHLRDSSVAEESRRCVAGNLERVAPADRLRGGDAQGAESPLHSTAGRATKGIIQAIHVIKTLETSSP